MSFEGPALSNPQEKRQFSDIGSHFRSPKGVGWASQVVLVVKNLPANAEDARDTSWDDPLEEVMATYCCTYHIVLSLLLLVCLFLLIFFFFLLIF